MENFTNETLDTLQLPRYEEVQFSPLHPNYRNVILGNSFFGILIIVVVLIAIAIFEPNKIPVEAWIYIATGVILFSGLLVFFSLLSYKKKAFAFRNHDVIYRSGIIATTTMVIPYNRIQHVALHEGLLSRYFGLAKVEIFTAGGNASDLEIPGIAKAQAEDIKQLLMGKIQKQL